MIPCLKIEPCSWHFLRWPHTKLLGILLLPNVARVLWSPLTHLSNRPGPGHHLR